MEEEKAQEEGSFRILKNPFLDEWWIEERMQVRHYRSVRKPKTKRWFSQNEMTQEEYYVNEWRPLGETRTDAWGNWLTTITYYSSYEDAKEVMDKRNNARLLALGRANPEIVEVV